MWRHNLQNTVFCSVSDFSYPNHIHGQKCPLFQVGAPLPDLWSFFSDLSLVLSVRSKSFVWHQKKKKCNFFFLLIQFHNVTGTHWDVPPSSKAPSVRQCVSPLLLLSAWQEVTLLFTFDPWEPPPHPHPRPPACRLRSWLTPQWENPLCRCKCRDSCWSQRV